MIVEGLRLPRPPADTKCSVCSSFESASASHGHAWVAGAFHCSEHSGKQWRAWGHVS